MSFVPHAGNFGAAHIFARRFFLKSKLLCVACYALLID